MQTIRVNTKLEEENYNSFFLTLEIWESLYETSLTLPGIIFILAKSLLEEINPNLSLLFLSSWIGNSR